MTLLCWLRSTEQTLWTELPSVLVGLFTVFLVYLLLREFPLKQDREK